MFVCGVPLCFLINVHWGTLLWEKKRDRGGEIEGRGGEIREERDKGRDRRREVQRKHTHTHTHTLSLSLSILPINVTS